MFAVLKRFLRQAKTVNMHASFEIVKTNNYEFLFIYIVQLFNFYLCDPTPDTEELLFWNL